MARSLSVLLLLLAGCASPFGASAPDLRIRTDRDEHVGHPTTSVATVEFTVTNEGVETIYLPRCGENLSVAVDRREDGEWRQAQSGICPANQEMSPVALEAGESIESAVSVDGPGQFRIRGRAGTSAELERYEQAVSNDFTVEHSPMG